jgi:hypothetical protein
VALVVGRRGWGVVVRLASAGTPGRRPRTVVVASCSAAAAAVDQGASAAPWAAHRARSDLAGRPVGRWLGLAAWRPQEVAPRPDPVVCGPLPAQVGDEDRWSVAATGFGDCGCTATSVVLRSAWSWAGLSSPSLCPPRGAVVLVLDRQAGHFLFRWSGGGRRWLQVVPAWSGAARVEEAGAAAPGMHGLASSTAWWAACMVLAMVVAVSCG